MFLFVCKHYIGELSATKIFRREYVSDLQNIVDVSSTSRFFFF